MIRQALLLTAPDLSVHGFATEVFSSPQRPVGEHRLAH